MHPTQKNASSNRIGYRVIFIAVCFCKNCIAKYHSVLVSTFLAHSIRRDCMTVAMATISVAVKNGGNGVEWLLQRGGAGSGGGCGLGRGLLGVYHESWHFVLQRHVVESRQTRTRPA